MRLIDADKLIKSCQDEKGVYFSYEAAVTGNAIDKAPTVDAVPVVRCKDCKHFEQFRPHDGFCTIDGMLNNNDHFCSYGERKGGDE